MIIVLTGSPFSGKTTLLKELSKNGVKIFHADIYIKKIYKANEKGYELIKNEFGSNFVNDKEVDKRKLAEFIVEDDSNLTKLNELIHPLIKEYLDGKDNFVAELPIVTNSSIKFNYDKLILVKASDDSLQERFFKKNIMNQSFIEKIIKDWNNEKISFDYVVDTTNDIKEEDISNIINMLNEK